MLQTLRRLSARAVAALRSRWPGAVGGQWSESRTHRFWARSLGYRLYLPAVIPSRGSLPLLVMLHGCDQDAAAFAAGTRMNAIADIYRFMVLYPEQSRSANRFRCWNWFSSARGESEAAMIVRLIDAVRTRHAIDARRIYLVGMSAGAALARLLALHSPWLFAASAVHSGMMYRGAASALQAISAMRSGSPVSAEATAREWAAAGGKGPLVPLLVIHGERDTAVNPVNAQLIVAQTLALAAAFGEPLEARPEQWRSEGGRRFRIQDSCRGDQLRLRSCLIEELGHAWSGGDPALPFNDAAGPHASEMIWEFLAAFHSAAIAPAVVAGDLGQPARLGVEPKA